jgi:hypothetical protein
MTGKSNFILVLFFDSTRYELIPIKNQWKWAVANDPTVLRGIVCPEYMKKPKNSKKDLKRKATCHGDKKKMNSVSG